jgi:hypothetical protein
MHFCRGLGWFIILKENPLNILIIQPSVPKTTDAGRLDERGQDRKLRFMSQFYITAVRYSTTNPQHITHVLVHTPTAMSGRLNRGQERTKNQVIADLAYNNYNTALYNYNKGTWTEGAAVSTIEILGVTYLRTLADSTRRDNLGNLLHIDELR